MSVGEEIGRLLLSVKAHQLSGANRFALLLDDMGEGEKYVELLLKLADQAGLLDVQYSILFASLSEVGELWAKLFAGNREAQREYVEELGQKEVRITIRMTHTTVTTCSLTAAELRKMGLPETADGLDSYDPDALRETLLFEVVADDNSVSDCGFVIEMLPSEVERG